MPTDRGGRPPRRIDADQLRAAIAEVEGGENPPRTQRQVFLAVAAKMGRKSLVDSIRREAAVLGIETKAPPGKAPSTARRLDITEFTSRGLKVNTIADLLTSVHRPEEENKAIEAAWEAVRKKANV